MKLFKLAPTIAGCCLIAIAIALGGRAIAAGADHGAQAGDRVAGPRGAHRVTATASLFTLRPPGPSDRSRVDEIVRATGVFRPAELTIALEVFDSAVAKPSAPIARPM